MGIKFLKSNLIFLLISAGLLCPWPLRAKTEENRTLRIVSLAPSTTEILFALQLDEEIVGVSQLCDYPPRARKKENVGTFSQPNIEKILSLRPDIILCAGLEQAPVFTKLKQLNLKVFTYEPSSLSELFAAIGEIGELVNRKEEALALIGEMKNKIEMINSEVKFDPHRARPKVFVEIWYEPLITAGKNTLIDEILTLAGGQNIAHDIARPYLYINQEVVIERNPDCIILAYMAAQDARTVCNRPGWNNIAAVKSNRIYGDINPDLLLRAGPRIVQAIEEIHKKLYP